MPAKGPASVLVYHPDEAQAYARLVRAPRGQIRLRVAATPETALPFVEEMDVLYTWGFPAQGHSDPRGGSLRAVDGRVRLRLAPLGDPADRATPGGAAPSPVGDAQS